MTRPLLLEDFATERPGGAATQVQAGPTSPEEAQLDAYEAGYKSGWDDCIAAEQEVHRRIGSDLAAALGDISLTHAAARAEVLSALGPLFEEVARTLLPRLAADAVAPTIIAELREAAEAAVAPGLTLLVAPDALPVLQRLVEDSLDFEVRVTAEPAFAPAQVSIRSASERRDIDLAAAADRIAAALRDFMTLAGEGDRMPEAPRRQANDR
ncbi:MAG: hypothetical protein NXH79_04885 [Rhodobacteraceae bacterium]|nr:hypothetical protein [Paracoccaceae bacterium]